MVKKAENGKKHIFSLKMCVLNPNFGNKVTSINLYYRNSMRYSILGEIIQAKHTLKRIIWVKKAEICQKTRFFLKNVCFETRFGQLSGIQQLIPS